MTSRNMGTQGRYATPDGDQHHRARARARWERKQKFRDKEARRAGVRSASNRARNGASSRRASRDRVRAFHGEKLRPQPPAQGPGSLFETEVEQEDGAYAGHGLVVDAVNLQPAQQPHNKGQ